MRPAISKLSVEAGEVDMESEGVGEGRGGGVGGRTEGRKWSEG